MSLPDYEAQLEDVSLRLDNTGLQPAQISRLRSSLPAAWVVDFNGEEYRVPLDWLTSALADMQMHPKKVDALQQDLRFRLATMRKSALDLEKGGAGVSKAAARAGLNEILQRREFAGATGPSALQRLEERIARGLFVWVARLLRRLHIGAKTGNRLAWTFIIIVFFLVAYWVFRVLSRRTQRIEMPSAELSEVHDSRAWVSDALAAAGRDEYREAIRCAYWAVIVRLEDRKLLPRDLSRTPRELLSLLQTHAQEEDLLRDLTTRFETVWYGCRDASAADWSGARAQLEKIGCLAVSTLPTANS